MAYSNNAGNSGTGVFIGILIAILLAVGVYFLISTEEEMPDAPVTVQVDQNSETETPPTPELVPAPEQPAP